MLSLYRPRKPSDSSEESDKDTVIPAGRTYFTKVNGKLVMAREKKPKAANIAIDLLGEAFGTRTLIRRRSRSVESKSIPLLLTAGTPFNPAQVPVLPYTAPIPQQSSFQTFCPYPHPPQRDTQPFTPYHPQPWNPSMIPVPQILSLPQHYTVSKMGSYPQPSKEDFEALKRIDAHFNEFTSKKTKRLSSGPATETNVQEEVTTKTQATITKHVCANCGRLRSKKYYAENPLQAGETPKPAFCKKCQKDTSETSDSDTPTSSKSSKKQDLRKSNTKKKKKKSTSSSEDVRADSPHANQQEKSKSKHKPAVQKPKREYIIVAEDFSEEERIPRGRQPMPQKSEFQDSSTGYLVADGEFPENDRILRGRQAKSEKKEPRSPSPTLGYVVVEEEHSEDELIPREKPCSHRIEQFDAVNGPRQRQYEHHRHPSGSEIIPAPHPMTTGREDGSDSFDGSQQSRRRRIERANLAAAPWDVPDVIYPQPADENIVATDRFVHNPKKHMEEQRRKQEYDARSSKLSEEASNYYHGDWSQSQEIPSYEQPSKYYHDDWVRDAPVHSPSFRGQRSQRTSVPGRYRRDSIQGSLADSEKNDYYRAVDAVFHDIPPEAPSPPPSPSTEPWPEATPFEDTKPRRGDNARGKASRRAHAKLRSSGGSESSDDSIKEMITDGMEKALVLSPKKHHSYDRPYGEEDLSSMAERERFAERETKRVTFQDLTPSPVPSVAWSRWSDASESFLKRKTSWDNSAVGPVPVSGDNW